MEVEALGGLDCQEVEVAYTASRSVCRVEAVAVLAAVERGVVVGTVVVDLVVVGMVEVAKVLVVPVADMGAGGAHVGPHQVQVAVLQVAEARVLVVLVKAGLEEVATAVVVSEEEVTVVVELGLVATEELMVWVEARQVLLTEREEGRQALAVKGVGAMGVGATEGAVTEPASTAVGVMVWEMLAEVGLVVREAAVAVA